MSASPEARPGTSRSGRLSPEAAVSLRLGGATVVTWHCTPVDLDVLAKGWLFAEGITTGPDDLLRLRIDGTGSAPAVEIALADAAGKRLWAAARGDRRAGEWPAGRADEGAEGARHRGEADRGAAEADGLRRLLEDPDRVSLLFRDMFGRAELRSTTGGVHTGGLVRDGTLVAVVEDVSRHHVVDRLVGSAFGHGGDPAGTVFLLSSRISGAMASKACRAGVAALVSRSIPSELAASIAAGCGLVLVGRARGPDRHVHWPD